MGKKVLKNAFTRVDTISKEELTYLQELVGKVNNVQMQIGGVEAHKHELLHSISLLSSELRKKQTELKEIYGDVNIDLATGTISDADNKEN
jgi:hypothetical protein